MANDSISRQFAAFVNQLAYEDLSKNQVYKVKIYFLDWLGSAYAGQSQPVHGKIPMWKDSLGQQEGNVLVM